MLAPGIILQQRYKIICLINQGGMGAVYEALDERLGVHIALKETLFTHKDLRKAFEREAKLLANLDHRALPKVKDHFVEGNGQFLVMPFIPGYDLRESLENRGIPFPNAEILKWADELLDALDYLHSQNPPVIHLDIKPQNLKVTERGQIFLLDFGLAKGTPPAMSEIAAGNSLLGCTLEYAPPEQLLRVDPKQNALISHEQFKRVARKQTDARADIYSLAATLYHLATGETPKNASDRLIALSDGKPDPLLPANQINRNVPAAMGLILMRAMSLNRDERQATVSELRKELLNFSSYENGFRESSNNSQEPLGTASEPDGSVSSYAETELADKGIDTEKNNDPSASTLLEKSETPETITINSRDRRPNIVKHNTWLIFSAAILCLAVAGYLSFLIFDKLKVAPEPSPAPIILSNIPRLKLTGHNGPVLSACFSPDGSRLATGGRDQTIQIWDINSGQSLLTLSEHSNLVSSVTFSPNGKLLASSSYDMTVRLWDPETGELKRVLIDRVSQYHYGNHSGSRIESVAISPDGKTLATGGYRPSIVLWDMKNGEEKHLHPPFDEENRSLKFKMDNTLDFYDSAVSSVAFSPDGKTLASGGSDDKAIKLWDTSTGLLKQPLAGHGDTVFTVAFSNKSELLASGSKDHTVKLRDARTGKLLNTLPTQSGFALTICFSPDGNLLAIGTNLGNVEIWNVEIGRLELKLKAHDEPVHEVAFSPDGMLLVSASEDATIKIWDISALK